ncbi:uncharacterized protein B0I36DRAFT_360291 [Microdochium trichocladiopsis]|uniref:Uncharacterized protein n=1 Tax=Microdochium trichocladiopsis TaxID=1682393 RepID=A0A9P8YAH9_9PEZI|nr:uncharacterized protein B0I36DRAFT_360291 [Microdochium trichocladiopsis]KAH7034821.1 hypothetical protein B0I36DRAFT_360291 [Microdochium trichocladiopsis]
MTAEDSGHISAEEKRVQTSFPETVTYADAMCTACSRILHANWVNILEYEHRWMHERGACGCPVVFPALMGPRVIDGGRSADRGDDDPHSEYDRVERYRSRQQLAVAEPQVGYQGSNMGSDTTNTQAARKGRRVKAKNKKSARDNGYTTTHPAVAPLFQEHGPNDSPDPYRSTPSASYRSHNNTESPYDDDTHQIFRVAIRLPSLYAAEWTQDHRLRHEDGLCQCPVSFERYLAGDYDYGDPEEDSAFDPEAYHERDSEVEVEPYFSPTGDVTEYEGSPDSPAVNQGAHSSDEQDESECSSVKGLTAQNEEESSKRTVPLRIDDHYTSTTPGPSRRRSTTFPRRSQNEDQGLSFMERVAGPAAPQPVATTLYSRSGTAAYTPYSSPSKSHEHAHNQAGHSNRNYNQHERRKVSRTTYNHAHRRHNQQQLSRNDSSPGRDKRYARDGQRGDHLPTNTTGSDAMTNRLPIAGFPIGAGPEGHSHAGDFEACCLRLPSLRESASRTNESS